MLQPQLRPRAMAVGEVGHVMPIGTTPFVERIASRHPDGTCAACLSPGKPGAVHNHGAEGSHGGGSHARSGDAQQQHASGGSQFPRRRDDAPGRAWAGSSGKRRSRARQRLPGYAAGSSSSPASNNFSSTAPTAGTSSPGSSPKPVRRARTAAVRKRRGPTPLATPGGDRASYTPHNKPGTSKYTRRAFGGQPPPSPLNAMPKSKSPRYPFHRSSSGDVRVSTLRSASTGELRRARTQIALSQFADPWFVQPSMPSSGMYGLNATSGGGGLSRVPSFMLGTAEAIEAERLGLHTPAPGDDSQREAPEDGGTQLHPSLLLREQADAAAAAEEAAAKLSFVPTKFQRKGAAKSQDVLHKFTDGKTKQARTMARLAPTSTSTGGSGSAFRNEIEAFAQSPLVRVPPRAKPRVKGISRDVSFLQDRAALQSAGSAMGGLGGPGPGELMRPSTTSSQWRAVSPQPSLERSSILSATAPAGLRRGGAGAGAGDGDGAWKHRFDDLQQNSFETFASTNLSAMPSGTLQSASMTLPAKANPAIPRSLIPDEDHITSSSAVLPPQSLEEESVYDTNRQEWVTKVFPSVAPAGRRNVELLEQWLNSKQTQLSEALPPTTDGDGRGAMAGATMYGAVEGSVVTADDAVSLRPRAPHMEFLARLEAVVAASADKGGEVAQADRLTATMASAAADDDAAIDALIAQKDNTMATEDIMLMIHEGQRVFSIAFHEVVRQVSVTCIERGQLLAKVWSCYMRLFDLVERISEPLRDDVRLLREKLATEVHRRQDQEAETQRRDETISKLEATIQEHKAAAKVLETRVQQAQRENSAKDLQPYANPEYRQWAHLDKNELLAVVLQLHKDGEEARANKQRLDATTKELERVEGELSAVRADNNRRISEAKTAEARMQRLSDAHSQLRDGYSQLRERAQEYEDTIDNLTAKVERLERELAQPPAKQPMWPELPPKHEPKLKMMLDEIVAKEAVIAALKEHIRKTSTFTLPSADGDIATNAYSLSMVDPTERGTQTMVSMSKMDELLDRAETHEKEVQAKAAETAAARHRANQQHIVPPIWTQLVTLLPSKMKVNEWGLGRVKRMILNCYVEKLKTDSLAGARRHDSMLDMPPFVVDYLYNLYGVRRVVQVKLKQLIMSMEKYIKDKRVKFFGRVCGFVHKKPVSAVQFGFYLNALSFLVTDLQTSQHKWLTTHSGTTWVPESSCVQCVRKLQGGSAHGLKVAEDLLADLPRHCPDNKRTPKSKRTPKHAASTQYVSLDVFLDAMTKSYQAVEDTLLSEWDEVFTEVDEDNNGVLDLEEFVEAVRLIADLQVPPFHARKVFVEESHRTNFDFVDRSGFRTLVGRLFHSSRAYTGSQRRLGLNLAPSAGSLRPGTAETDESFGGSVEAPDDPPEPVDDVIDTVVEEAGDEDDESTGATSTTGAGAGAGPGAGAGAGAGASAAAGVRVATLPLSARRRSSAALRGSSARRKSTQRSIRSARSVQSTAEREANMAVVLSGAAVHANHQALHNFSQNADGTDLQAEIDDLRDLWSHVREDVEEELSSKHQTPTLRLNLITRTKHIEALVSSLSHSADGDDGSAFTSTQQVRSTWQQVRGMINELKQAVKKRRRNSAAFIQRLVRTWSNVSRRNLRGPHPSARSHMSRTLTWRTAQTDDDDEDGDAHGSFRTFKSSDVASRRGSVSQRPDPEAAGRSGLEAHLGHGSAAPDLHVRHHDEHIHKRGSFGGGFLRGHTAEGHVAAESHAASVPSGTRTVSLDGTDGQGSVLVARHSTMHNPHERLMARLEV